MIAAAQPQSEDAGLPSFTLAGRVALITGASGGIGLHLAGVAARAGAEVVLCARRQGLVQDAARILRDSGQRAHAVAMDVTNTASITSAFEDAERLTGRPVSLLVNNAGIMVAEKFLSQKEEDITRVFDTNLKGAFIVAQHAARRMTGQAGGGVIINIASTSGLRAGAFMASYGAAKAGLIHLTRVMALELARKGVRVNVLCPGNIDTDMQKPLASFGEAMINRTPLNRFGRLDDLDGPFLLLASDAGRYMTGASLVVDGGQTLSWM